MVTPPPPIVQDQVPGATQELYIWACTDKLLEPGQALTGAPTVPTSRGVGTQSPTVAGPQLAIDTCSWWLCHSPAEAKSPLHCTAGYAALVRVIYITGEKPHLKNLPLAGFEPSPPATTRPR